MQKNKLGIYDIFIVSKYLETIEDFENIERATKKAKDLTYKFKFNPIELDLYSRKLFKNIETFHIYISKNQIILKKINFIEEYFGMK